MNETNFKENNETVSQNSISSVDIPDYTDDTVGSDILSETTGYNSEITDTVSSGDSYTVPNSLPVDISGNDIGNTTINTLVGTDYTETLETIKTEITAINKTVALLFFFILLAWAEKKITVVVKRFSTERKR